MIPKEGDSSDDHSHKRTYRPQHRAITRIWDVVRNGQVVAQLFKCSEPFAKWRLNNGSVRETFGNKTSALLFAGTL